jgi:peroxiredoxin
MTLDCTHSTYKSNFLGKIVPRQSYQHYKEFLFNHIENKMKKITFKLIVLAAILGSFNLNAQEKVSPALLGGKFPEFKLQSNQGKELSLADLKGKNVILVFPRGKVTDIYWCGLCHYQYSEMVKMDIDKKVREKNNIEILFVLPYPKDSVDKWIVDIPGSMAYIEKKKKPENPNDEKQKKSAEAFNAACPVTITYKDGKFPATIPVLIDGDHSFSSKLGIYREEWDGTKTGQNVPTIFILDTNGVVRFKFMAQNTFDRPHAEYLLDFIKKMM